MKAKQKITRVTIVSPDDFIVKLGLAGKITYVRFDTPSEFNQLKKDEVTITTEEDVDLE